MSEYGINVSRTGYDVDEASDKQLAFSSRWPLLPIEREDTINLSDYLATPIPNYTHGLGYAPVFMAWLEDTGGKVYPASDWLDMTDTKITFNYGNVVDPSFTGYKLHWKIFRRDLTKEYLSTIVNVVDATKVVDEDCGIKISLKGKDVDSTDPRDFSVRSDRRQLIIHKSGITPYTTARTLNFTASSSSSGSTLVSTTSVFIPNDVGKQLLNVTDGYTSAFITGYTSPTTVTLDTAIGDTWDGDTITSDTLVRTEIEHDLGYLPMFLSYINSIDYDTSIGDGEEHWRYFQTADDAYITADADNLVFSIFYSNYKWAYLIFKDTMEQDG